MARHELKVWPEYFAALQSGEKTFELRRDDRDFRVNDTLILREWDPSLNENSGGYTGEETARKVVYVLRGIEAARFGLQTGYVIMGLAGPLSHVLSVVHQP